MTGTQITPPLSIWAIELERAFAEAVDDAETKGRRFEGELFLHAGQRRPDLWQALLRTLDALRNRRDLRWTEHHDLAAERLEAMLRDRHQDDALTGEPVATSEALVEALERWLDVNVFRDRRDELGIPVEQSVARILRDARRRLHLHDLGTIQKQLDRLEIGFAEIRDRPGAPEAREVGDALREVVDATRRLAALLDQAEAAAPAARGGQPGSETRARLRLAEDLWRAQGCGPRDKAYWVLLAAIWEKLDGEAELPRPQTIRDHLQSVEDKERSKPLDIITKTLD